MSSKVWFWVENHDFLKILKKPSSWTCESEKNIRKLIFFKLRIFPKNYDTWAPFWYIYFVRTPITRGCGIFGRLMSSIFFRWSMDTDIRYIRISKKSFEKVIGGMPDVNIPFWSRSYIFREKKIGIKKLIFKHFFGLWSPGTRFFENFQKIMIFDPKPYFWTQI